MTTVNVTETITTVTVEDGPTVTVIEPAVEVVSVGIQGPPGPPGSDTIQVVAGQNLSALRVVYADPDTGKAFYADKDTLSHSVSLIGVTTEAVSTDDSVGVQALGILNDGNWNFDTEADNALYLGSNGAIVQGVPSGAYVVRVGFVVSQTKAFIRINQPILH